MKSIRSKKGAIASIAALSLASLALVGCTPDNAADNGTLSIFAPSNPQANPDMDTNTFTKLLEEKFDVKFSFETTGIESGPAKEKRQIALGSGDYPDLFMLVGYIDAFSQAEVLKLSQQKLLVPLQDLIKEYAPNVTAAFEANPEFRDMATSPDGSIYAMPQWSGCYHCAYQSKLWMNSAWLDKVGLQQPSTTEQMRQVLTAFKTQDPNGNGVADEIPLSASVRDNLIPYFMNAFVYDPQGVGSSSASTLVLKGDKVALQADTDGWREGLSYINSLYAQGLIDPGAFTQDSDALKTLGDNAAAPVLGAATVLHPGIFVTIDDTNNRHTQYDAVPPLTGPEGANFASYNFPSAGGFTFALTNKSTEAERITAIKMLDYFFTDEGQLLGTFGEEGVGWRKPVAGDVALDPTVEPLYAVTWPAAGEERNSGWGGLVSFNNTTEFRNQEVVGADPKLAAGYERRLFDATKLYDGHEALDQIYPFWAVWFDEKVGAEVATLQTNIESYVSQNSVQFITGAQDVSSDAAWGAYLSGLEGLGLDRYLALHQAAYDKSGASKK